MRAWQLPVKMALQFMLLLAWTQAYLIMYSHSLRNQKTIQTATSPSLNVMSMIATRQLHRITTGRYRSPHKAFGLNNDQSTELRAQYSTLNTEQTITALLNKHLPQKSIEALSLTDAALKSTIDKANFWMGGNFVIQTCSIRAISSAGITIDVNYIKGNKPNTMSVLLPYPIDTPAYDERSLKVALISMLYKVGKVKDTAIIASLEFGDNFELPTNFRFNDVPHREWVRAFINDLAKDAVLQAINDEGLRNKSRLQMKLNFPEVNPAFDTYRIGTILEIIRHITLCLVVNEGLLDIY